MAIVASSASTGIAPNQPAESEAQFLKRLDLTVPDVAGVQYDREQMHGALRRYASGGLTIGDVQQLALVDAELGIRARAKQLGFVDLDLQDPKYTMPLPVKAFLQFLADQLRPTLTTYQFTVAGLRTDLAAALQRLHASDVDREQLRQTITRLEQRVLELEADRAAQEPAGAVER
jgi:hypothetical protein